MSTPQDGGPAFPVAIMARQADGQPMTGYDFGVGGMSLRDWFAGMALQGAMANPASSALWSANQMSVACFNQADAMIAARQSNTR